MAFVPGVAVAHPLTVSGWGPPREGLVDLSGNPLPDAYVAIPWGLIVALVVGLPIVVGLVLTAATQSRLPMTARLEQGGLRRWRGPPGPRPWAARLFVQAWRI